jgi:hypothetical protein
MTESQIYAEAGRIIQIAMGKENQARGDRRRSTRVWRANEDPLAYWLGVEAIVSLVQRAALKGDRT